MERYKFNELSEDQSIKVAKEMFFNSRYKDMCIDAKLLYGLLIDRLEQSMENNWINEKGELYLIFTRDKIEKILQISDNTCAEAFKNLGEAELIKEVNQGLGKPNLIFINHIIID